MKEKIARPPERKMKEKKTSESEYGRGNRFRKWKICGTKKARDISYGEENKSSKIP